MSLRRPTEADTRERGAALHPDPTGEAVRDYRKLVSGPRKSYGAVEAMGEPAPDLVAMPTTPTTADESVPDRDRFECIADAWGNLGNTCAFNMTGHPSLGVPVEPADGLPVGPVLAGGKFEDAAVLNAGHALERAG